MVSRSIGKRQRAVRGLYVALLAWIAGTALFYYLRFTFAFVHANKDAIRALFGQ